MRRYFSGAISALLLALLAGCAVGPKYQRPKVQTPTAWKEIAPFRAASPKDSVPKGNWWEMFGDQDLNRLEAQSLQANQTIDVARNQLEQARAYARIQTAGFFPSVNAGPSFQGQRISGNRPVTVSNVALSPITQSNYQLPFNLNYELDLFGRVRKNVEAANELYQSQAANLENIRLVVESELAVDYFQLRELDAEIAVVNSGIDFEQKGLDLVERRHQGGVASGLDVAQQQTVLDSTRTQASLLVQQRKQYEHAIATLLGSPASSFSIAPKPLTIGPPDIPAGVPADMLERRPDVAQFERQVAAQNAYIGVAESGLYPSVNILGGGGAQSAAISKIFDVPSLVWSLGAGATQTVFSGGRVHAQIDYQKSAYGISVANYRQAVLTAFQQVEDGMSGLEVLSDAAKTQQEAVNDAQNALRIANDRYVGGITTYLDVITAQETLLSNQRLATQILGQRLVTSVYLVKALGGGWDARSMQAIGVHPTWKQAFQQ